MSFARFVPLSVLLGVGLLAFSSLTVPVGFSPDRFESKEFGIFKTRYEELSASPSQDRVELIRKVSEVCQEAPLSSPVIERMQIFSQTILHTREEASEVKSEVRRLLRVLDARRLNRAGQAVARKPTSSS